MKKSQNIIIAILFIICITLSISSISMSANIKESNTSNKNHNSLNIDPTSNTFPFDVSDFSGKEINTIDIAAKKYQNNTNINNSTIFLKILKKELYW